MYTPLNLQAATDRILAALSADTPTLATVNSNVTTLGGSTRLGSINGIDRGTIFINDSNTDLDNTATVGAVVLARSLLSLLGTRSQADIDDADDKARRATMVLTNTTTITFSMGPSGTTASSQDLTGSYELVEYNA